MSIENENPEIEKKNSVVDPVENQSVEKPTDEVSDNEKPQSEVDSSENHTENETSPESEIDHQEIETAEENYASLSLQETLNEMETIVNKDDSHSFSKKFNALRDHANHRIADETEDKKHDFVDEGNEEEHFEFHHPHASKLSDLVNIFREKQD